jgi:hypothetical protein
MAVAKEVRVGNKDKAYSLGALDADRLRAVVQWAIEELGFENPRQWRLNAIKLGYPTPPNIQPLVGRKGDRALARTDWRISTLVLLAEIFQKQGLTIDGNPIPLSFLVSAFVADYKSEVLADYTQVTAMLQIQRQAQALTVLEKAELAVLLTQDLTKATAKAVLN